MKKLFYLFVATFLGGWALTSTVFANGESAPESPIKNFGDVVGLLEKTIVWMYRIFFIIAVAYILIAAFTILTEKDKAKAWEKGRAQLTNAAIAVVVALVASGFAAIVKSFLTS